LVKAGAITSANALAEAYATLSGDARLKISPQDAARMVSDLAAVLSIQSLTAKHYVALIEMAPTKAIRGGSFFDALHAQAAWEARCDGIHTLNVRHFQHVAPDLTVHGL
jgi:predicted nucleic acid-binding protein